MLKYHYQHDKTYFKTVLYDKILYNTYINRSRETLMHEIIPMVDGKF